jgi:hypothetical protein
MANADKKVLGVLPKQGVVGTVLGGLIVAVVLALIWGYILEKSYDVGAEGVTPKNSILVIVELLLLAALVGIAVGLLAKEIKPSVLWVAGGLGVVAVAWAQYVMGSFLGQVAIDTTVLDSMGTTGISLSGDSGIGVSIGTLVLAAVAAACVKLGSKIKI